LADTIERKRTEKIWFNQQQRTRLNDLLDLVNISFDVMSKNLEISQEHLAGKEKAAKIEKRINAQHDLMRTESQEKSNQQDYNVHSELIYHSLFSSLERIGDHLFNISNAVINHQS